MEQKRLPIGYYLKLLDNCLTKGIDEILSQHGLNRIEWQVLSSIYEKPEILKTEILKIMKPFADSQFIEATAAKFIDQGQVQIQNSMVTLTPEGRKLHQSCFDTQQMFRTKVVAGISDTNYQITISTLQKMIANIP